MFIHRARWVGLSGVLALTALAGCTSIEAGDATATTVVRPDAAAGAPTTVAPEPADTPAVPGTLTEAGLAFGESWTHADPLFDVESTVVVDEVREAIAIEIRDNYGVAEGSQCVVVVGSATLDKPPDGESIVTGFELPDVRLIDGTGELVAVNINCPLDVFRAEGLTRLPDIELATGESITWFQTFVLGPGESWTGVAVNNVVYSPN